MKKKIKKLALNLETLRNLEENDLARPVGGLSTGVCSECTVICTLCHNC
jgi:hypothetical protein